MNQDQALREHLLYLLAGGIESRFTPHILDNQPALRARYLDNNFLQSCTLDDVEQHLT